MMKSEFIELIDGDINQEDWEIINIVYTYYPRIKTKQDIADLYLKYGMIIIKDMYDRSKGIMAVEQDVRVKENELEKAKVKLSGLYNS